jgi:hypothetical protein
MRPVTVLKTGHRHADCEYQPNRVHLQVACAPFDLLTVIKSALEAQIA